MKWDNMHDAYSTSHYVTNKEDNYLVEKSRLRSQVLSSDRNERV